MLHLQRTLGNRSVTSLVAQPSPLQAKMTLGAAGDKYEQEADLVARQVVARTGSAGQTSRRRPEEDAGPETVKRQPQPAGLRPARLQGGTIDPNLESVIQSARGGGKALDEGVRTPMEQAFGADFSAVRLHTDSRSEGLNRLLQSRAFTTGQDIFMRGAEYAPATSSGRELLAHELTHTLQQSPGPSPAAPKRIQRKHLNGKQITKGLGPQTIARQPAAGEAGQDVLGGAGAVAELEGLLRQLYLKADLAIYSEASYMLSKGAPVHEVAKWANEARNQAKAKIRAWSTAKAWAEQRNLLRYGDKLGPSYEQLKYSDPSKGIRPRSDKQIIESAAKANPRVSRWAGRLRIAGRIAVVIDLGIAGYNVWVASPQDRPKVLAREVAGIAGAAGGAWAGAKGGAAIGAFGGPVGAAIGGILGGIGGAILGGWAARKLTEWIIDELYPPSQTGFEGSYQ